MERTIDLDYRARTAILRSTAFLGHDTGEHPERAARVIAIDSELERRRLLGQRPTVPCTPAPDEAVLAVHDPDYLKWLKQVTAAGGGWIDGDTVARSESLDVARTAAGGAINAVDALLAHRIDRAFLIARPPGHHATASRAMGFCLLNTVAIAAAHALANGLTRLAILDWDVHHGNGTQDIFYERSDVFFCSLHQYQPGFFPGTGGADETGRGDGDGFTLNLPLPPRTGDATFLAMVRGQALPAIERFAPQLLIVSAGYDAHADDPLGGMALSDDAYRELMTLAIDVANRHCDGRLLAVLEGGYNTRALARCVADAIELMDSLPEADATGTS